MKRRHLLALTLPAARARAQAWPDHPVRLIVPFAAGTTTDILGRIAGTAIAQGIGQPVVVDNRSGAGGTVGTAAVAQAAPDGHTLLFGTNTGMCAAPALVLYSLGCRQI